MATVPVKAQTAAATVQRPGPGQTGLTVTSLPATASPASKPATSSPGTSAPSASTATVIQNVSGQNIIKQVGRARPLCPEAEDSGGLRDQGFLTLSS